jgi:hypothetical protein
MISFRENMLGKHVICYKFLSPRIKREEGVGAILREKG